MTSHQAHFGDRAIAGRRGRLSISGQRASLRERDRGGSAATNISGGRTSSIDARILGLSGRRPKILVASDNIDSTADIEKIDSFKPTAIMTIRAGNAEYISRDSISA